MWIYNEGKVSATGKMNGSRASAERELRAKMTTGEHQRRDKIRLLGQSCHCLFKQHQTPEAYGVWLTEYSLLGYRVHVHSSGVLRSKPTQPPVGNPAEYFLACYCWILAGYLCFRTTISLPLNGSCCIGCEYNPDLPLLLNSNDCLASLCSAQLFAGATRACSPSPLNLKMRPPPFSHQYCVRPTST